MDFTKGIPVVFLDNNDQRYHNRALDRANFARAKDIIFEKYPKIWEKVEGLDNETIFDFSKDEWQKGHDMPGVALWKRIHPAESTGGGGGGKGEGSEEPPTNKQQLHAGTLRNFVEAKYDADSHVLSAQDNFLDDREIGSSIYVRGCYEDWFDMIRSRMFLGGYDLEEFSASDLAVAKTRQGAFVFEGPPGVGKTSFVPYLVWSILTDEECRETTIVYRPRDSGKVFILQKDQGMRIEKNENPSPEDIPELADPAAVYICDSQTKEGCRNDFSRMKAFIVYLTSPDREGVKTIRKDGMMNDGFVYCHNWSYQEIESARKLVWAPRWTKQGKTPMTENEVLEKFEKWGGNPRNVFVYKQEDLDYELDSGVEPKKLLEAVRSKTARKGVSHRFLCYEVTAPVFWRKEIRVASEYIVQRSIDLQHFKQEEDNEQYVLDHLNEPAVHGYLGQRLESVFHRRMQFQGIGTITLEDTEDSSKKSTIDLPIMKVFKLVEEKDVACQPAGTYGKPFKGNFPSIDAFVPPNLLFQVTLGASRPVKAEPVRKLVSALAKKYGTKTEYKLIFVTIPENVAFRGPQRYEPLKRRKTDKKGDITPMQKLPAELKNVKQYIYRMPIGLVLGQKQSVLKPA